MSEELDGAVALRPKRSAVTEDARDEDALRAQLLQLQRAAEKELARRSGASLEPADAAPVPIEKLSSISREIPRLASQWPQVLGAMLRTPAALRQATAGLAAFSRSQAELATSRRRGDEQLDEFGFDREWTETLVPFFTWLYRHYWRVKPVGLENVPGRGRALLVSNHSGVLPYDGAMIRTAIYADHPSPRHARALILNAFFGIPMASWFLRRSGNTLGHPDDAQRLLERDELVLVFPEGAKGTGKPYRERYRLRRFGRGGFVQLALRTGSPIIPVSVVGGEEIHPMLADLPALGRLLGLPYFPLTPTFPWLGPLGMLPLPNSWVIEFHQPISTRGMGPRAADDAALVMQLADRVRDTIQVGLYRNLERRGTVFA
jgi:1-acyl-sn-glycerol-3-phosphate acyltransferase